MLLRIVINGEEFVDIEYDFLNGRIVDGFFGYGIVFLEEIIDFYGN